MASTVRWSLMSAEAPQGTVRDGGCQSKRALRTLPVTFLHFLEKFLEKSYPTTCRIVINSFYLVLKLKEPRIPSIARGGRQLQRLSRSKVSDVADIRESFF